MTTNLLDDSFNVGCRDSSLTSNGYTVHFWVDLVSQDVPNNKSIVNIYKTMKGINGWAWNQTAGTDTLSGAVSNTVSISQVYPTNTVVSIQSLTNVELAHNSDGTLTTSLTTQWAYGSVYNKYMAAAHNKTYPIQLPTIARASLISIGSSNININNTTGSVSYTITPYSSSFTHSLIWGFGSNTATISNASSGSLTYSQLLGKLTSSTSGTLTLTLVTYSNGTEIGRNIATASVTIDTSVIKPTISLGNITVNSSPIASYLVAGYSSAKITSTAGNSTGSTGVTTTFTASHGTLSPASSTSTSAVTVTSGTLPSSTSNYPLTITASVKDSRGVTVTASKTATVYGYSKPTATLEAYRTATANTGTNTDTDRDDAGAYVYVTFSGTLGASVNNQNSIQSTTCTYSGSISGTTTNRAHYSLTDSQSATFTLTVEDKVSSSTATVTVGTSTYALDLRDDGSGHVSVGLGGLAPDYDTSDFNDGDYVMPYLPIRHVEQNYIVTTTGTDLNDYREAGIYYFTSSYTPTNIPIGVNGWLMVINAPNASQVKQIWWRQGTNGTNDFNTYVRQYAGGAWSNWTRFVMNGETVTRATGADGIYITDTNPTSSATYYPVWVANKQADTVYVPRANDGLRYLTLEGTTDANGYGVIKLGNAIKTGTAGNKYGLLDLFDKSGGYYGRFTTVATLTANRTYTLPNSSGTVLLQNANNYISLFNGTLNSSTTSTEFTGSNYSAYLIVGADLESTPIYSTMTVPRATITTTAKEFRFVYSNTSGNNYNGRFSLVASANTGGTITLTWLANGTIREVYGIK